MSERRLSSTCIVGMAVMHASKNALPREPFVAAHGSDNTVWQGHAIGAHHKNEDDVVVSRYRSRLDDKVAVWSYELEVSEDAVVKPEPRRREDSDPRG